MIAKNALAYRQVINPLCLKSAVGWGPQKLLDEKNRELLSVPTAT